MKRILLLIVVAATVLACGTSKTVRTSKKVIKGEWSLDNIAYSEYGTFRMTFFKDASKDCLEGSQWKFIPNNNTGVYTISKDNCLKGDRNFIFNIQEIDPVTGLYAFMFKPTDKKHKFESNRGFKLQLTNLTDTEMQWQQLTTIDGKQIKINMNFIKINEK